MKNTTTPTLSRYDMDKAKVNCFNKFVSKKKEFTFNVYNGKYTITFKVKKCRVKKVDPIWGDEQLNRVSFSIVASYSYTTHRNGAPYQYTPSSISRSTATRLNRKIRSHFGYVASTELSIFGLTWPDVSVDDNIKIDWVFDSPSPSFL